MSDSFAALVLAARRQVAILNRDFAELTGVSLRTVERHAHNGGISSPFQTRRLIAALHPKDPALAAQLAAASGTDLAALGIAAAAAPPAATDVRLEHADSVLVAAANAIYLPPEAVRPAVAAAFARAVALGVSFAGLAEQLSHPAPSGRPLESAKG